MYAKIVGGVKFNTPPVMIGAGVCKTPERTRQWLEVAPVVSGSYTLAPRNGNEGEKLFYPDGLEEFLTQGFGLNSFGMPNQGLSYAAGALEHRPHRENPLIVSVAGFRSKDYEMAQLVSNCSSSVSCVELNLGCPNTEHGKIMSFDLEEIEKACVGMYGKSHARQPLWLKLSPYSDPGLLKEVAEIVNKPTSTVRAVVTCNTFPNAFAGKNAISPNGGLAGLSGSALKPIALGQVVQFREYLRDDIDVIGVGGITTGNDIVDFLDAGAAAVQLASLPFWLGQPRHFWQYLTNNDTGGRFAALMNQHSLEGN